MNIIVDVRHGGETVSSVDVEGLARFVLEQEGLPESTELSISFVDDEEIRRLNKEFRGIDRATDVLSFECDGMDDGLEDGGVFEGSGMPEEETFLLGDVIIATDVAEAQTERFGTTPAEELHVLLVHGLLHLCGWDHVHSDEEAEEMEARERDLLAGFGMPGLR